LVERFQHDDMLAARKHDAPERDHTLVADRIADDCERFLTDLVGGRDVIRTVEITVVDLGLRYKAVDVDCVGALDLDLLDLVVLDLEILALADLVAAADVILLDKIAGLRIDQLLLQPIAGLLVDAVEGDALGRRRRGIERDRTRDERKLEVSLPVGTRGHVISLTRGFGGRMVHCRAPHIISSSDKEWVDGVKFRPSTERLKNEGGLS